ncbi:MAG: DHA2 family efflux MFS transporter permease subunit [Nocardioidaceae bacterium]
MSYPPTEHAVQEPTGSRSRRPRDGGAGPDRRRWLVLAVIVAAQFMVVLDVAIVNVAQPSIKSDLSFSQESLQWVITAYAITFGGVLLLGGRLADLLGRRRLFMAGLLLFTASSLLDGLAWSEGSLIAFRSLQGLGAALLSPAALSILTTTFREGRERNVALGIWGAASGSGGAVGVLLGGALTSALSWSWIFYINLPAGLLVLAVSPWLLKESWADLAHRHFDFAGAVSITGGLMILVYAMTRATQHGWGAASTVGLLATSAALILAFLVIESRSKAPLMPMRIFRLRTLTASNVSGLLLGSVIFSQFFLLTLYMQQVLHYSALKTGVAYIGLTLTIISVSAASQALVTKLGIRRILPVGLALSAAALILFARLPVHGQYFADLLPGLLLSGVGLALAFVPVSIGGLTGVRQADAGVASGLINTSQQIGGAIGVAVATTVATSFTGHYLTAHPGTSALDGAALTHGFEVAFYVLAALAALGAVLAALLVESKPAAPEVRPVEEGRREVALVPAAGA